MTWMFAWHDFSMATRFQEPCLSKFGFFFISCQKIVFLCYFLIWHYFNMSPLCLMNRFWRAVVINHQPNSHVVWHHHLILRMPKETVLNVLLKILQFYCSRLNRLNSKLGFLFCVQSKTSLLIVWCSCEVVTFWKCSAIFLSDARKLRISQDICHVRTTYIEFTMTIFGQCHNVLNNNSG